MKKVLFTATVDSHILLFHIPYLKYFKDKGYEVHVATNGCEKIPYCDKKFTIPIERSPYKINNLKAVKQLKKIINEEKYEVIHTHTPMGSVVTRFAAKYARKHYGTKVIYTAHGFHFFKGAPLKNWLLFYPVEKFLARYTDILITMNEEDYNLAKNKFKTNVKYVHGVGLDETKFDFKMTDKEKCILRESIGIKENDFVMIYPAELSIRKNQEWLINSIYDLLKSNSKIHLLLPGKDSLNGKIDSLIRKYGLEKQVHLLGFRKDIPNLFCISDVAISTSKQEGLPVNIMEAMYLGLPIIATDCRGNRDLIEDGINGFIIDQGNSMGFVEAIKKIYNKNVNIIQLAKNSNIIINTYTLDQVSKEMYDVYDSVLR